MSGMPFRQVRARHDEVGLTVYQAYAPEIAEPAVRAGRFVPPFSMNRMTWIKPSFLWMMYRSGWGTKPGQERVLAIEISHDGLLWALRHACLSHFDAAVYTSRSEWAERLEATPVRVQWDPERSLAMEALDHRSLQVGLGPEASRLYVEEWTVGIRDATDLADSVGRLVRAGRLDEAAGLLPEERPYPLPPDVAAMIGATE